MRIAEILEALISKCNKCAFVDRPFIEYKIYRRYLPSKVKILIISESPPPGEKPDHLYNLSSRDRLRKFLLKMLKLEDEESLIQYFLNNNIFWTNAIKCRPPSRSYIERMRRNCLEILKKEVELIRPTKIIAAGLTAQRSVRDLRLHEKFRVICTYHPLYIARFRRDLIAEFIKIFKSS